MTNGGTDGGIDTLVLKDSGGNYFLVPMEALERGRVPAEQRAEVERAIDAQGDVQGYVVPLAIAGALAFGYGMMAGAGIASYLLDNESDGGSGQTWGQVIDNFVQQGTPKRP